MFQTIIENPASLMLAVTVAVASGTYAVRLATAGGREYRVAQARAAHPAGAGRRP